MVDQEEQNQEQEETQKDTLLGEVEEETVVQDVKEEENSKEQNLRNLREAKELVEKERDELLRRIARSQVEKEKKVEPAQEDFSIAPDDLVEGKHLSKYDRKIKELESQVRTYQEQSTAATVEARLRTQFPDFESVVTEKNVELLAKTYPELAQTIKSSGDLYNKAVSAYTLIKQFGIKPQNTYDSERARAHANSSKPRPLASVSSQEGDSPLTKANAFADGLTEDLKKQLYKEMIESRR